jgi:hypothetical protein
MTIRYHQRRNTLVPDYRCATDNNQRAGPVCQQLPGHSIDQAIGQLLLDTVTPLALEVALTVQPELEARADEADRLRRSHVQRAHQNAELARRRYLAVDPDNRLVADTLEADWNETLRALQAAQDEYDRQTAAANTALDDRRKNQIRRLATDFPKLWTDPATPDRERKRIVRLLIEDVTINKTDQIHLHIRFRGGQTTSLEIPIPLNSWQVRQTDPDTITLLDHLLDDHTDAKAAELLNAAGRRSGTGQLFTARIVLGIRRYSNLPSHADRLRSRGLLTLQEIATQLGVHPNTIKLWHRAGLLTAHTATRTSSYMSRPPPATRASSNASAGGSSNENQPNPSKEVHYETNPFCCGEPLAMNSCSTFWERSHSASVSAMNSRPLSERIRFGLPCLRNRVSSSSTRSRAPMLRATRQPRHRLVYSSTMFRIRSGCPFSVRAATKS